MFDLDVVCLAPAVREGISAVRTNVRTNAQMTVDVVSQRLPVKVSLSKRCVVTMTQFLCSLLCSIGTFDFEIEQTAEECLCLYEYGDETMQKLPQNQSRKSCSCHKDTYEV